MKGIISRESITAECPFCYGTGKRVFSQNIPKYGKALFAEIPCKYCIKSRFQVKQLFIQSEAEFLYIVQGTLAK